MNLAKKYRPTKLQEVLSQEHLLGEGGLFSSFLKNNYFPNALLFGSPGCGKTTISRLIAKELDRDFYEFNATSIKVDELRKTINSYRGKLTQPLIFIDEIHRLSKNQQEVLLPFMENGDCIIIGASTQNPYYSLTAAFRSRSHLFELHSIKDEDLEKLLIEVAKKEGFKLGKEALEFIVNSSSGDARGALNLLESASFVSKEISLDTLKQIRPHALQGGSNEGDSHYELSSAMIKSIRGSNIDAGLYYLARLIEGGEPPEFLARRLCILASEDIGNANPNALNLASSTLNIVLHIGYPEARIPLAQLVIYLASSPKSNTSYSAINSAQKSIKDGLILPVPNHIKTHAKDYLYPHNFGGYVEQEYLKEGIKFYQSSGIGFEKTLNEWLGKIKDNKKVSK